MPSKASVTSNISAEVASTVSSSKVDPKLYHLVKKIVATITSKGTDGESSKNTTSCAASSRTQTLDEIVALLREQHREYLRKDPDRLKAQVDAALRQMQAAGEAPSTLVLGASGLLDESDANSGRKRKNRDHRKKVEGLDGDESYDKDAEEHDLLQKQHMEAGGGGLNATLRNRYRKVQLSTSAGMANSGTREGTPSQAVDGKSDCTGITDPSESDVVSPKMKRKNVVKVLRRASSSNLSLSHLGMTSASDAAFLTPVPRPTERYTDLGGMDRIIKELRQLVEYPLLRPELYLHLGIDPPRGVLLRGPPGTGKTHVANAVAGELGIAFFRVSAPELVSGMSGESEGRIRELFATASRMAPAMIFLDEIDCIAPKREDSGSGRGMEKRMVAQLLTCLDMLAPQNNRDNAAVMVLAATNRPEAIDAALRRAGRFDREILLGVPDEDARESILRTMTRKMRLSGDFDFKVLARKTPGFVGADVHSLAKEAAVLAIDRIFHDAQNDSRGAADHLDPEGVARGRLPMSPEQMEGLYVSMNDFLNAVPLVQPSSKREGFATVPDVSWSNIGALQSIREELTMSVLEPIRCPEKFKALGLSLPAGVLLYGPPGCGKTLLAKAIANESGANFISVKGPELLDKYVGESERAVRLVFERARSSSPCIVFFDELDSLVPRRGSDSGGGGVSERVVNQLLTELDGLESRRSVFVIAATNRPELIDPAMLRPGRLDKLLYVPLPTPEDRASILQALATNVALGDDVDLESIGKCSKADGYSGADCSALLREAGLAVLKEDVAAKADVDSLRITARHFDAAFSCVMPSVSRRDEAQYLRIRDRIARARSRADPSVAADTKNEASKSREETNAE